MTSFLRLKVGTVAVAGLLFVLVTSARADSITFTDSWKDSAQSGSVVSVDTGTFSVSLTIPGLGNLTTEQLTQLVVSASLGDISLPGDFTNSPKTSLNSITSTQVELNNSGQPVQVGSSTSTIKGDVVTINASVQNPSNAKPFPIFADQFLGTNGPIVSRKLMTLSISGAINYSLQKIIYITGKGTVTQGAQLQTLNTVQVSGNANFAPPTLTFISPAAHAKLTNDNLTVYTLIKDSGSVSNVQFSLNGGAFQTGTDLSSNIWTSAVMMLVPGTNVITAYAVDADGYFSTTNILAVQYVVVAPLIVNIVGNGTLKQDYNGMFLAVGSSFNMTAKPSRGFGFYYWNVGTAMSNNPTLTFIMVSNLVITANFKDITPPTVTITAPKANAKFSNTVINVTGTASDNVGVTAVGVKLNGNDWVTANGTTSWSTNLMTVASGPNTVQAYAMDAAGNISKTNVVKFLGELPPDWAPVSIAGSTVLVGPNSGDPVTASFDASTFSQTDTNGTGDSGTGTYSYSQMTTNSAELSLTFDAPLSLSNSTPQDIELDFTGLNTGTFTNSDSHDTGSFSVEPATTLVPTSWSSHTVTATSVSNATPTTVKFSGSNVTINHTGDPTRTGTFVATDVSPIGAMLVVTYTDAPDVGNITYLQVTFTSKTGGYYEVNTYGSNPESDYGTFTFR